MIRETSEQTEQLMENLLSKAQGLVEDLIDFKSAFPKCDALRIDNCASKSLSYSQELASLHWRIFIRSFQSKLFKTGQIYPDVVTKC